MLAHLEPCSSCGVVYVVGPGEGYEYVDVEQRCHGQSLSDW